MPNKIITYKMPPQSIEVGIPFTWGLCNAWAIKVDDGDMYYLEGGRMVHEAEEEILMDGIVYANSIEIK